MSNIQLYLDFEGLFETLKSKANDVLEAFEKDDKATVLKVTEYMKVDNERLHELSKKHFGGYPPKNGLGRHLSFAMDQDFKDIIRLDIPEFRKWIIEQFKNNEPSVKTQFDHLLDPLIVKAAVPQFISKQYRDAVLNSVIAVFDLIRKRSGSKLDGAKLIDEVFKLENPTIIFSELETDSGQNDQKGFMNILKGAYIGIRNVKSHSLTHDLDEIKAAQYLVFASMLVRRIREAQVNPNA